MNKALEILKYVLDNWETLLPILIAIYEVVASAKPTEKNLSLIDNVVKLLRFILPNRRKPQPTDIVTDEKNFDNLPVSDLPPGVKGKLKNRVLVNVLRHIIPVILVFFCVTVSAQTNGRFKSIALYNADSLTVRTETTGLVNTFDSVFVMYLNEQSSPAKLRCFTVERGWYDCPTSGGGISDITGLIEAGTNVVITGSGTESDPYIINSSGGGGGIVNGSAINELPKTIDLSGNLGTSGVESQSAGNLNLGLGTTIGGDRNIRVGGTASDIQLNIFSKGVAPIRFISESTTSTFTFGNNAGNRNIGIAMGNGGLSDISLDNTDPWRIRINNATAIDPDGNTLILQASSGWGSGNTNGGGIWLNVGSGNGSGTGGAILGGSYTYANDSTLTTKGYVNNHSLSSVSSSTAGGTITLDFDLRQQRIFTGSASFATAKILAISNDTNAMVFDFHFEVTNVAATITTPADFYFSDANFNGTLWTPPATGLYEMGGSQDSNGNWKIKIQGPFTN